MTDPLLQAIRNLQQHNPQQDCAAALDTLHRRLQKIAKHPFESKYRMVDQNDATFHKKMGRLQGSVELLEYAGFVRTSPTTLELYPSAEAWPKLMQSTALLSQAVREAQQSLQMNQSSSTDNPPVTRKGSASTGKSVNSSRTASTSTSSSPDFSQGPKMSHPPRPNNSDAPVSPGQSNGKISLNSSNSNKANQLQKQSPPPLVAASASNLKVVAPKASKKEELPELVAASASKSKKKEITKQLSQPPVKVTKTDRNKPSTQPPSIKNHQQQPPVSPLNAAAVDTSAIAMIKAAALKAKDVTKEQKQSTQSMAPTSPRRNNKAVAATPALPPKESNKGTTTSNRAASSAIAKLKVAVLKAKNSNSNNETFKLQSPPKIKPSALPPSAATNSAMEKIKSLALMAGQDAQQQQQQGTSSPNNKSPNRQQQFQLPTAPYTPLQQQQKTAIAGNALAKFKAAAALAAKHSQQAPVTNQAAARQNPLKLAAQRASTVSDDDESVRSERSLTLRDLALHNSATNLMNSPKKIALPGSALAKFKAAAQNVQQQQQLQQTQQHTADPRARFQNAAQALMMQNKMMPPPPQSPMRQPQDPRLRFQNAAQAMMMQQKALSQDPRAKFQGAAMMMMMQQTRQQQLQPLPSPGKTMTAAARWKMAATAAQATARIQGGAKPGGRMGANWDGLSYPTSADAGPDGLSYPTADAGEPPRRSRSFDDGRPIMLKTDSGRSLMSASSERGPPNPNNMALVPASPRRGLTQSLSFQGSVRNMGMSQQSLRGLNAQQSMRGMQPQQSMRGMQTQQSMRGMQTQQSMRGLQMQNSMRGLQSQPSMRGGLGGPARPQLKRENSLSLRDLQRGQVMGSQRGIMVPVRAQSVRGGGSVSGESIGGGSFRGGPMVSGTPKEMSKEQPKGEEEEEEEAIAKKACSCISSLVNWVTFGELSMDLITTVLSFKQMGNDFSCCDQAVDYGVLALAVTVPYFFLIIIELLMLAYSILWGGGEDKKHNGGSSKMGDSIADFDDESTVTVQWQCTAGEALSWVVCVNPFLGCLITWTLMYEINSKNDALLILGIEGGAIVLMFVTIYLERNTLSTCTMMVHLIPLVPFTVTCFVVWYYLEKGGICFIMKENTYWFEGCEVCADGWPPDDTGRCPDGDIPVQETFCGEKLEDQFCYFGY